MMGGDRPIVLTAVSLTAVLLVGVWWIYQFTHQELRDDKNPSSNNAQEDPGWKLPSHLERELAKESRRKRIMMLFTMKKPMYDNIFMYDPQGKQLCSISQKKAMWYVRKGLAVWRKEDAKNSIQLTFQPQINNEKKDPLQESYNKTAKRNVCVVCGSGQEYMRHYVIPYCYRSLFPDAYKTHLPHDVVLTCPACHVEAERSAHQRMRLLERDLRRRVFGDVQLKTEASFHVDGRLHKLKSAAQALLQWKHRLPIEKIEEYTNLIQRWEKDNSNDWSVTRMTWEQKLQVVSQLDDRIPNPEFISGPDLVLKWLLADSIHVAMENFIRSWRQHFLETMHPRYLPKGWSIESPVRCDTRSS